MGDSPMSWIESRLQPWLPRHLFAAEMEGGKVADDPMKSSTDHDGEALEAGVRQSLWWGSWKANILT